MDITGWDMNTCKGTRDFQHATSALQIEAMACYHALKWASSQGYTQVLIRVASVLLVSYLRSSKAPDIVISWTVRAIKQITGSLKWCQVEKVARDQVKVAHDLAN